MKTYPSQRQFGLPAAIVASAHAILFLGFSVHHPKAIKTPSVTQPIERTRIEFVPEPEERHEIEELPGATPSRGGEPAPSTDDRPSTNLDPTTIQIPVEHTTFSLSTQPILTIPREIAPVGPSHGRFSSIGELDFAPHALARMSPTYPSSMKSAGQTGTVTVMFTVDESGRVIDASVVNSTHWEFEQPALRAIFHWRFEPGKRHGQPTAFRMSIPLHFVLEN